MAKVVSSLRWRRGDQTILYRFMDTRDLGGGRNQTWIEQQFRGACDEWAGHTGLLFTQTQGTPDLEIRWATKLGKNPDGHLIAGNTEPLSAYASPSIRMTFSDEVAWSNLSAPNFGSVALHELGHGIGMGHSGDTRAIMFPTTDAAGARHLEIDDKVGARYLYRQLPLEYNEPRVSGH